MSTPENPVGAVCHGQCARSECPFERCVHTGAPSKNRLLSRSRDVCVHKTSSTTSADAVVAAVDVGSTMLAARLLDLGTGVILASGACLNPQACCGADVMTRIAYARNVKGGLGELRSLLAAGVRGLLEAMTGSIGAGVDALQYAVIAGNTTMLHLLSGISPSSMGTYPYTPETLFGYAVPAASLDIGSSFEAYLPPCVSAFIGADIVCGLVALSDRLPGEDLAMMDLGTNAEMAIWRGGEIVCASAAAGPVFEGGGIRCGMPAVDGAICHVWVREGFLALRTICDEEPLGICGSGLVDAVASFLELGYVDETGAMEDNACAGEQVLDEPAVPLCPGIVVTQGDVRRFQTAKAAVAAGFSVLEAEAGKCRELHVCGGLGTHLGERAARRVGLVPAHARIVASGNTSLEGASLLALHPSWQERAREIQAASRVVDLAAHSGFARQYVNDMLFASEEDL